jgi:hypothetical protein
LGLGRESEVDPGQNPVAYNRAALGHEHLVAKYCTLLGTSLAGVVAYEDRTAVRYLRSRRDVVAEPVACLGLSGGGCRAALLHATCEDVAGAVIVGMMTTHPALLDRLVEPHLDVLPAGIGRPRRLARPRGRACTDPAAGAVQP